jgi:hypothetical protein
MALGAALKQSQFKVYPERSRMGQFKACRFGKLSAGPECGVEWANFRVWWLGGSICRAFLRFGWPV